MALIETSNYSTIETFKSLLVPREIIFEILLRLPVESLLRCKSVCKLWFSLISDPHFVKSHLKQSTANAHHQLFWINVPIFSLKTCPLNDVLFAKSVVRSLDHGYPLSRRPYYGNQHMIDSCNGLLCIVVDHATPFICNPSTRIWNRLPYYGFEDPFVVFSFGYDDSTDDYKVLVISWGWKTKSRSTLFSLKSATWKKVDGIPEGIKLICYDGKFSNGAIHWEAEDSKSSCMWAIVSFDLAKETYGQVSQPVYDDDGVDKSLTLGVLGESLCVLCDYFGNHADVWVMKVYGVKGSWTKLVSIPFLTPQLTLSNRIMPLFLSNDDGKLLLQLGKKLVVYDSKNNSSYEIQNVNGACPKVYVESLVSPNTGRNDN